MGELISHYQPSPSEMRLSLVRERGFTLTPRRRQVLDLVAQGFSKRQIGEVTGTKTPAVKGVMEDLRGVFEADCMAQVVLKAVEFGVIDPVKATADLDLGRVKFLSSRQRDVLRTMIRNCGEKERSKEIADKLFLSEATVKGYFLAISERLGTRNRTHSALAFIAAQRKGLLSQA